MQDIKETFKPINGYLHRYFISNLGRVKSHVKEPRILKNTVSLGREKIILTGFNGEKKNKDIARLVFEAFRYKIPKGKVVKFKDGNKLNNKLDNLYLENKNKHLLK